ncbi:MAG: type II secretion system minor pseudopilin GspK [Parvularculaceae bacterium]
MTDVRRSRERGAALIIVLLLVATLSFVLLSISTVVTGGVKRGYNERARSQLIWRSFGAARVAREILSKAAAQKTLITATNPGGLFLDQLTLPDAEGAGAMRFADATRCFNVNALGKTSADGQNTDAGPAKEFTTLISALGLGESEAAAMAAVIGDWIDIDISQNIQGAEDSFYTALPVPFRTGGGQLASVSELRAMDRITEQRYLATRPFLCALPSTDPVAVNLNALTPRDAPLIYAMTGGDWGLDQIKSQIESRPPGGWPDEKSFWQPYVAQGGSLPQGRTKLVSDWVEVRARLAVNDQTMEEGLLFKIEADKAVLYSRSFGESQ